MIRRKQDRQLGEEKEHGKSGRRRSKPQSDQRKRQHSVFFKLFVCLIFVFASLGLLIASGTLRGQLWRGGARDPYGEKALSEETNEDVKAAPSCDGYCASTGECRVQNDRRWCECMPGYTGITCNADVDECISRPCGDHGTCHNLPGTFRCQCHRGYAGTLCNVIGEPARQEGLKLEVDRAGLELRVGEQGSVQCSIAEFDPEVSGYDVILEWSSPIQRKILADQNENVHQTGAVWQAGGKLVTNLTIMWATPLDKGMYGCGGRHGESSATTYVLIDVKACVREEHSCNSMCLSMEQVCNGVVDCPDFSDEMHCQDQPVCTDRTLTFACRTGGVCLYKHFWCNGFPDCPDASDEPTQCSCNSLVQFSCSPVDGRAHCLPSSLRCDGKAQCPDGLDEMPDSGCENRFQCGQTNLYVPRKKVCDMKNDCGNWDDENTCDCSKKGLSSCIKTGSTCYESVRRCDGFPDCPSGSDESPHCDCVKGQMKCDNNCLPQALRCDGITDCFDGSDEMGCSCSDKRFLCLSGHCVASLTNHSPRCNGIFECPDISDEIGCGHCDEFECENGVCQLWQRVCDRHNDCGDKSDEIHCPCADGDYRCGDGECLSRRWLCDGTADCDDAQDEAGCAICEITEYRCHDTSCVAIEKRCDGVDDCDDGSDESDCLHLGKAIPHGGRRVFALDHRESSYQICAAGVTENTAHNLCRSMGYINASDHGSAAGDQRKPYAILDLKRIPTFASGKCASEQQATLSCLRKDCDTRDAHAPYSWHAQIIYQREARCSGALVHPEWVITSADCVTEDYGNRLHPRELRLRIGSASRTLKDSKAEVRRVDRILLHEDYSLTSGRHDLALLHLYRPVNISGQVRPVCLPDPETAPDRHTCYVVGWGLFHRRANEAMHCCLVGPMSENLHAQRIAILEKAECEADGRLKPYSVHDGMLCTDSAPKICQGDSGGPLVCRDQHDFWYVHGIRSWAPGCNSISLFTDIRSHLSWIKKHVDHIK